MKILVLTSATGGGHNMRANSLKAWSETPVGRAANLDVSIHLTLENTHNLYRFGVGLYNFIQMRCPSLHHLYFNYLEKIPHFDHGRMIQNKQRFQEVVCGEEPDIVLSTHAHLNHGFFELAQESMPGRPPKTVTCCGELHWSYGFSKRWVNPKADLFVGAVPETCHAAQRLGMPINRIYEGGSLLRPPFLGPDPPPQESADYVRHELGLDPGRFLLVLGTGANGANHHIPLLEAMHNADLRNLQVLALCSQNKELSSKITRWADAHTNITVRTLPYIKNMKPLLQAASALVCRSGTGLTSEAILCQCPIIFDKIGGVMPQENITLAYCRRHRLGQSFRKATDLPEVVSRILRNPEQLTAARQRKERLRPQKNPQDLIRKLSALLDS